MENRPSVRKGTNNSCTTNNKYPISKKISKPVKVVYISNPMKVKASVSEFRSLVQELTGRDSDISSVSFDRSRYTTDCNEMKSFQDRPSENMKVNSARNNNTNDIIHQQQHGDCVQEVLGFDWMNTSSDSSSSIFEPLYDIFVPGVMENMNGVFAHAINPLMEAQPHLVDFSQKPMQQ